MAAVVSVKILTLAKMYTNARTMRLVDGPDEVHNRAIARIEMKKYIDQSQA
jgi:hypothetical protein